MRCLVDTNVILEIILKRKQAEEARQFLSIKNDFNFYLSDFSLNSLGLFFQGQNNLSNLKNFWTK